MVIKINYTSSDVYVSTSVSPVYVVVNYSGTSGGGAAVWGDITGTLSDQTDLQDALDDKVPYSGATGDVDLGEYELKAGQVEFDQSPTGTAGVGVLRWNNTDGTLDLGLKGGNVTLQVGQEQVQRVVNKSGGDLLESAYQVVKVTDAQGQRLAVDLAQGNNDANSTDTLGIVTETISNNQEGFITTSGLVRSINTTGSLQGETWADGDVIYLSPTTAGAITNVKPTAPNHTVILGYVVYAHANNGKIFVKCDNGYELGELHDVYVPTPSNNDGIFWNSSNLRYENKTIAGALGYTPVPTTRTLTINGTAYDLSADRSWTISASANTIYTADGTLTGNRTVDLSTYTLNFSNRINFLTNPSGSNDFPIIEIGSTTAIGGRNQYGQLKLSRSLSPSSSVTLNPFSSDNLYIGNDPSNVTLGSIGVRIGGSTDLGNSARLQVQSGNVNTVHFSAGNVMRFLLQSSAVNGKVWNLTSDNTGDLIIGQTYASITNVIRAFGSTSNVTIGGGTDAGYKLDVNGTGRFSDNLLVSKNQNAGTFITIANANAGASAASSLVLENNQGASAASIFKLSTGQAGFKNQGPGCLGIYNASYGGDIAFLNDASTGKITFAAGSASSAQLSLTAAGRLLLGTTTESTYLLDVQGTGRFTGDILVNGLTVGRGAGAVSSNTAAGASALTSNTSGFDNSAFGASAARTVTTGLFISAFGSGALNSCSTGAHNSAFGYVSLYSATGSRNSAFGSASFYSLSSGNDNSALGNNAGRYIAGGSTANTTSSTSIFIGSDTKALADSQTNQIVIGYNETGLGSNTTIIGNSSTTLTAIRGTLILGATSANASAQLQVDSTTKGFLPPRMTTTQKNAISSPAAGLMVFDTTLAKLCVYSGTAWETITSI